MAWICPWKSACRQLCTESDMRSPVYGCPPLSWRFSALGKFWKGSYGVQEKVGEYFNFTSEISEPVFIVNFVKVEKHTKRDFWLIQTSSVYPNLVIHFCLIEKMIFCRFVKSWAVPQVYAPFVSTNLQADDFVIFFFIYKRFS